MIDCFLLLQAIKTAWRTCRQERMRRHTRAKPVKQDLARQET